MPAVRVLYISVAARELLTALECVGVANFTDLGTRYSLPKDWDTISIVYNAGTLNATGGNPKILDEWKRNPPDGGDIVQVIGKLTLDRRERQERARSGLRLVEGQGVLPLHGHRGCYGQSCWSLVAASTGWRFMDKPLGTACHIDDQHPIDTMTGLTSMSLEKGWVVPEEQAVSLQAEPVFNAGKAAHVFQGSWTIGWLAGNTKLKFGFGRLPIGPESRICIFNGLADSIWAGSMDRDEARERIKNIVGS